MEILWQELTNGLPDAQQLERVVIRLIAAVLVGAIVGYERERAGKPAGLRTHMLVSLGTCVLVVAGSAYGMSSDGLSRVIQGIATGIGFIGTGSILKIDTEHRVHGLTTAAGIWITAAIGVTVGLGMLGLSIAAAIMTVIVLAVLRRFESSKEETTLSKE